MRRLICFQIKTNCGWQNFTVRHRQHILLNGVNSHLYPAQVRASQHVPELLCFSLYGWKCGSVMCLGFEIRSPPPLTSTSNALLTVPRRCFCCDLFWLSMFVHFLFVFDLLFNSFRIALWPSIGKELSPWLFTWICCFYFSAVLIVGVPFPFGVWGRMWNSIVSVSDHCLFIYFALNSSNLRSELTWTGTRPRFYPCPRNLLIWRRYDK